MIMTSSVSPSLFKGFSAILLTIGIAWATILPSAADDAPSAENYVTKITQDALTILRTHQTAAGREEAFGDLIDRTTNMRRIARFTLGPVARSVSDEELARFEKALRNNLVKIYANRLASYTNERVETQGEQKKGRNHLVASKIIFASERPPLDMTWWIIEEKDGSFTLFDIQILGVWMAQEQRDIFTGILKSNNQSIDALIAHLEKQPTSAD